MFAKSILAVVSVFALASSEAVAKPIAAPQTEISRRNSYPSFNGYGGFSSMSSFDNFFGSSENFDGSFNEQIVVEQETEVVCESIDINFVQQRIFIMSEIIQEIILEQICEVEVQTIVIEQFTSFFSQFSESITRTSDVVASFDSEIVSYYDQVFNSDGSLTTNDLGFSGSSLGSNSVQVGGSNWNSETSPASVSSAQSLAVEAANCVDCS